MKRLLQKLTALAAIALAVGMVSATSAYAAPAAGTAIVAGTGIIAPGLTLAPNDQSVSFSGTGAAVAVSVNPNAEYTGPITCSFSGGGKQETVLFGSGTVSGGCSGSYPLHTLSAGCSLAYNRIGNIVTISGSCTVTITSPLGSGSANATVNGVFDFVPTSANPTTSYALAGEATLTQA